MPRTVRNPIAEFYQRRTSTQWALIGSLFAFLVLGYAVWDAFRDDPPPDVSDLLLDIQPVPDEENGLVLLSDISNEMGQTEGEYQYFEINQLEDPTIKDWPAIARRLEQLKPSLDRVPEALEKPAFTTNQLWHSNTKPTLFMHTSFVLRTIQARAELALHRGKFEEAWQDSLLALQLVHRLQTGDTGFRGLFLSYSGATDALNNIQKMILKLTPNPARTKQRIEQLYKFSVHLNSKKRAHLIKFHLLRQQVHSTFLLSAEQEYGLLAPIFYKPNRTLNLLAVMIREAIENLDHTWKERDFSKAREIAAHSYGIINQKGKRLTWNFTEGYHDSHYVAESRLATTLVALALAGYANQHDGELPEKLEELVPDYIDAIPLDPMDGKPLRYSRGERKIWSIGSDLTDEGGQPGREAYQFYTHDIVVEIPRPDE